MTSEIIIGLLLMINSSLLENEALHQQSAEPTSDETNKNAVLPAGTEIPLVLMEDLSTKKHSKGSLFNLEVAEDVSVNGRVIIPKSTRVVGEVTEAQKKGMLGRSGFLRARLLYAELPDRAIRLQGTIGEKAANKGENTAVEAASIGTGLFFISGRSASISKGTIVSGQLFKDLTVK